jgi:Domain of unknown function (DUF6894)
MRHAADVTEQTSAAAAFRLKSRLVGTIPPGRHSLFMARYYFHLVGERISRDRIGTELPGFEAAREFALGISHGLRRAETVETAIVVTNEDRRPIYGVTASHAR